MLLDNSKNCNLTVSYTLILELFNFLYLFLHLYIVLIYVYLIEINGFADDLYGNVTPVEIISSVGSLWNFGPGHQDAHELFHVVLSALDAEMQPAKRVRNILTQYCVRLIEKVL